MIPDAEKGTGPVMVDESGDARYIKGGTCANIPSMSYRNYGMYWLGT